MNVDRASFFYDRYSHGFLFPSEVQRVQEGVMFDIDYAARHSTGSESPLFPSPFGVYAPSPPSWAHSTVSKFGQRYTPPLPNLSIAHSIEAFVEGSAMSMVQEAGSVTPEYAWKMREGRDRRYGYQRVGGTVVVHFIKKNMWFLETALALLEGDRVTEAEALALTEMEVQRAQDGWEAHGTQRTGGRSTGQDVGAVILRNPTPGSPPPIPPPKLITTTTRRHSHQFL